MDVMSSNFASICFFQTDWDSDGYHQLAVDMRSADQLSSFRTSDWKVPQVKHGETNLATENVGKPNLQGKLSKTEALRKAKLLFNAFDWNEFQRHEQKFGS